MNIKSKYLFECLKSDGILVRIEGQVSEGRVTMTMGDEVHSDDIPIKSEETREIAVSTNFVVAVGEFICGQMGLPPDTLERLMRIQLLLGEKTSNTGSGQKEDLS